VSFHKNKHLLPKIRSVHFVTQDQVSGYILGQSDQSALFPVITDVWKQFYFIPAEEEFSEIPETTANGTLYNYSVIIKYPGFKPEDPSSFAALDNHKFILLLQFDNDTLRLIGNQDKACDFSWSFSISDYGFLIQWNLTDTEQATNYEHITQFAVNEDQMLVQYFKDANTYTLNNKGEFVMVGPQSPYYKYHEGELITDQVL